MAASAQQNGVKGPPPAGVWCPGVTLFDHDSDTLDLESQALYYGYLSRSGLRGLVILGTNAETFLLTREERARLIATARASVGPGYPLMAGISGHSTAQVLEFAADALAAGADYGLLLPPAYFGPASTPAVVERFFDHVAARTPLPLVLYNFPGVCNGVDMDSELIARLALRHVGRIVGVKLTCASVAKIARLSAVLSPSAFSIFGGQSDFLVGGLASGSQGCIAAFGNVFPATISRVYDLWVRGEAAEALELHRKAALAETPCKAGIASTKYAAAVFTAPRAGIEGAVEKMAPRHPYLPVTDEVKARIREHMKEVAAIEDEIVGKAA